MSETDIPTIERVRHDLKLREVTVARINRVSPGFASITFQGEALADFTSLSFDDHVKFMFNDASGEQVRRDYTPRRVDTDAREIDIEFARTAMAVRPSGRAMQPLASARPSAGRAVR